MFVTGISGSETGEYLEKVVREAERHEHKVHYHDIGKMMQKHAQEEDPNVQWGQILNAEPKVLNLLRTLAFKDLEFDKRLNPDILHLVDLHLSFRWKAYLTKGFEPRILKNFSPDVRCFINLIADISDVQETLGKTSWGRRDTLELLFWRDEELFLTDLFSDASGRVSCYAICKAEPPSMLERIIWHPKLKKVYLSFPITAIQDDATAFEQVASFRDDIRDFLVVFDPWASRDYDETFNRDEMEALRTEIGEATVERDYRFIDQADAVVVYYPQRVESKGVDAEMNYAYRNQKEIFVYCPENLSLSPFQVPPDHLKQDRKEYIDLLKNELGSETV